MQLRILHLTHGWPPHAWGGTEHYAFELVREQTRRHQVAVYGRLADFRRREGEFLESCEEGLRIRLAVNNFSQRAPWVRNSLIAPALRRDFLRFVAEFGPDLVHVHHLAGLSLDLARAAQRQGLPLVYQLQDWWALCARANLCDRHRRRCSGPGLARCSACLPLSQLPPAWLWNRLLYALRRALVRRVFAHTDAFIAGSQAVARDHAAARLLRRRSRLFVLPYGVTFTTTPAANTRDATGPLRCGIVGALLPHKGIHVAVEAFRGLAADQARLEVWGDPGADLAYAAEQVRLAEGAPVTFHGSFPEEEKPRILARFDLFLIPSVGLESFSFGAHEALAAGLPVVAARGGALTELLEGKPWGALVEPNDPTALRVLLARLAAEPQLLDTWRRSLPRVKSFSEHAAEVEGVYAQVLAARRGVPQSGERPGQATETADAWPGIPSHH